VSKNRKWLLEAGLAAVRLHAGDPDDLFDQAYAAEQIVAGVSDCQDELAVLVGATARTVRPERR
jgi:hypothetical protein